VGLHYRFVDWIIGEDLCVVRMSWLLDRPRLVTEGTIGAKAIILVN